MKRTFSCTRSGDFVFFQEMKACELTNEGRKICFELELYPYMCED